VVVQVQNEANFYQQSESRMPVIGTRGIGRSTAAPHAAIPSVHFSRMRQNRTAQWRA
jgi:hypothetical protein